MLDGDKLFRPATDGSPLEGDIGLTLGIQTGSYRGRVKIYVGLSRV